MKLISIGSYQWDGRRLGQRSTGRPQWLLSAEPRDSSAGEGDSQRQHRREIPQSSSSLLLPPAWGPGPPCGWSGWIHRRGRAWLVERKDWGQSWSVSQQLRVRPSPWGVSSGAQEKQQSQVIPCQHWSEPRSSSVRRSLPAGGRAEWSSVWQHLLPAGLEHGLTLQLQG